MQNRSVIGSILTAILWLGSCAALTAEVLTPEASVRQLLAAFNAHDPAAMAALCAEDVRWMSVDGDSVATEAKGVDALRRGMEGYFRNLPSARSLLRDLSASGPFVTTVEEAVWQAAGEERRQCSVGVYEVRQGKVENVWYFAAHPCPSGTPATEPAEPAESAESADTIPFHLPQPQGWRNETIPLPLGFAPDLYSRGLEELRFAPGMFDANAPDFWTYAFVWWLPDTPELDAERLASDLEMYFRGLAKAVAGEDFDAESALFEARFESAGEGRFVGRATTWDAFVKRQNHTLNVRVDHIPCTAAGHLAVFFQLSPQPMDHDVWQILGEIRGGFRCSG